MSTTDVKLALSAMAASGDHAWFFAHIGAGLLALTELAQMGELTSESPTLNEYRGRAQSYLADRGWSDASTADKNWRGRLTAAQHPLSQQLRNSGHGTIFLALAAHCLNHHPNLASERLLTGFERLSELAAHDQLDRYFGVANYDAVAMADRPPANETDMIMQVIKDSRPRYRDQTIDARRYIFTGSKIHIVTHLDALLLWRDLGESELYRAGLEQWWRHVVCCRQMETAAANTDIQAHHFSDRGADDDRWFYDQLHDDPHAYKYRLSARRLIARLPGVVQDEATARMRQVLTVWRL